MKKILLPVALLVLTHVPLLGQNQTPTLSPITIGAPNYTLTTSVYDMGSATPPAIQSFMKANVGDDWLLIEGRTNGLHNFTNSGLLNFPPDQQNTMVYVIDPVTKQVWSRSLTDADSGLTSLQVDELSTTAAQSAQVGNSLYLVGGYGYNHTTSSFQTFDTLTAIDVAQAIAWVKGGSGTLAGTLRQTSDPALQVTGGSLQMLSGNANLIFGQNFTGDYTPGSNGNYTDQVRTFTINDNGTTVSINNLTSSTPNDDYRRRDMNIVPILTNGGTTQSAVGYSGVFTTAGGVWTVPVEVSSTGSTTEADPNSASSFKQGMNGYKTTSISLYSPSRDQNHTILLGGISLEYYDTTTHQIVQDNNVPFINSISDIVRNSNGTYQQYYLGELPTIPNPSNNNAPFLFGAESEFLPSSDLNYLTNGIINLDTLSASTPTVLGYMFGGIAAVQPNFGSSGASDVMFAVTYTPSTTLDLQGQDLTVGSLSGGNPSLITNSSTTGAILSVGPALTDSDVLTFDGLIQDGTGKVALNNLGGVLTLTNSNTYTGGTILTGGELIAGSNSALGTGPLTVINGTLDVGGFSLSLGSLTGTGGEITSSVAGGSLTIDQTVDSAFLGTISGSLSLTFNGTGSLALLGTNTYTDGTTLDSGTLVPLSSGVFGSGPLTMNGGTLDLTSSPALQVNASSLILNGGEVDFVVNSPSLYSSISVADQGTVQYGGRLLVKLNGQFAPGAAGIPLDLIQGDYVSTGAFDSLQTSLPSLNLSQNGTQFLLTQGAFATLPGSSYTPNQSAVARYIDAHDLTGMPGDFASLVANLNNLSADPEGLTSAFDQLSPEKVANFIRSSIFNNASFSTQQFDNYLAGLRGPDGTLIARNGLDSSGLTLLDSNDISGLAQVHSRLLAWNPSPLGRGMMSDVPDSVLAGTQMTASIPDPNRWNAFITGNVVLAQNFSDANIPHADSTTGSVQLGADYRFTPHFLAGVTFGYGHTDATLDTAGSKATIDTYAPGIYASYADGGWYANALASYGFNSLTSDRQINVGGFSGTAHGTPGGSQEVANLDGGYEFHSGPWTFGPAAGLQFTHLQVDSFSETGAPGVDLNVNEQQTDSLRSRLGGRFSYRALYGHTTFTPHLDVSWQHEFLDQSRGITSQFNGLGAGSFTIATPNPSRDSALIDLGLDTDFNGVATLFIDYAAQAGQSNYFGQSVQAGVKVSF